ncbi:MAG: phosphoribosylformylglycinamidine synthase I [Elusimicrobiota bacterium]
MSKAPVKALVLRCAGTNCDEETALALEEAGAAPERVHVNALIGGEKKLKDYQLLAIPGGFSFGDDIASGKVLANKLLNHLREPLEEFLRARKPVIGVCNGFQVLVKCGLLPGLDLWDDRLTATLTANDSGKFECRWIHLKTEPARCPFVKGLPEVFPLPVAHGEGKFVPESDGLYRLLEKNRQIAFRYVDGRGRRAGYPANPNGSRGGVAGVCNAQGNVLGLMPHPERYAFARQHPAWTRLRAGGRHGPGLILFKNAVRYAKKDI